MSNVRHSLLTILFIVTLIPPMFLLILGVIFTAGALVHKEAVSLVSLTICLFGILGFKALFFLFNETIKPEWHMSLSVQRIRVYLLLGIIAFAPVPFFISNILGLWHGLICILPLIFVYYLVYLNRMVLQKNVSMGRYQWDKVVDLFEYKSIR